MVLLTNTEDSLAAADLATIIALDACEAGRTDAHILLAGALATISIGCDSYAAVVVSATKSLKTIVVRFADADEGEDHFDADVLTFRLGKHGYRARKHYRLTVGEATNHRPLEA